MALSYLDLAVGQQARSDRESDKAVERIGQGINTAGNFVTQQAEKNRKLSPLLQKYMNLIAQQKLSPQQAGIAMKLEKAGQIPPTAFADQPQGLGPVSEQAPSPYGYQPGMGAQMAAPQPPSPMMPPQASGGLGAPPPPQAPPPPMPQAAPSAPMPEHEWTVQEMGDAKAAGMLDSPNSGLSFSERYMLEQLKEGGKNTRQDKDIEAKGGRQEKALAFDDKKLKQAAVEAGKNREAAMERVLAQLKQSDLNNLRTNGTAQDIQLYKAYVTKLNNLRSIDARLRSSEGALFDDPDVLEQIPAMQAELERAAAEVEELGAQIKQRVAKSPTTQGTSQTTITTKPMPTTAEEFKKRRPGAKK